MSGIPQGLNIAPPPVRRRAPAIATAVLGQQFVAAEVMGAPVSAISEYADLALVETMLL